MEEIINTANTTYRYSTGTQSVIKSISATDISAVDRRIPDPLLSLVTTTVCARCCRPFYLAAAVENTSNCPLRFVFSADFTADFRALPEIFVNGVPIIGDIKRGVALCVGPRQTLNIVYGAVFPCQPTLSCCICALPTPEKICGAVRCCFIENRRKPPRNVFSNLVCFTI